MIEQSQRASSTAPAPISLTVKIPGPRRHSAPSRSIQPPSPAATLRQAELCNEPSPGLNATPSPPSRVGATPSPAMEREVSSDSGEEHLWQSSLQVALQMNSEARTLIAVDKEEIVGEMPADTERRRSFVSRPLDPRERLTIAHVGMP